MMITSILLLFHLLISFIVRTTPFSGCSRYLEASQLIYDADRLTGFSVMRISIKGQFRAIFKIIFFVNRILLLLSVLHLYWYFYIRILKYLVFFPSYCFSNLVSTSLVGKGFDWLGCLNLTSTLIDAVPCSVQLLLTILLPTGTTLIFKDAG